jgi:hypothetical protein
MITGALRSTPTDALDAMANLLPFHLMVNKAIHGETVRLASLPDTHPLARHIKQANKTTVKTFPSHSTFYSKPLTSNPT